MTKHRRNLLATFGPGLLVAATGVGAGDLATAAFTGSALGIAVLWAVLLGAMLKFVVNEGLARWQLVTGSSLLEGFVRHIGRAAGWLFLVYLIVWSFLVAAALMSAIGVTCHAIYPLFGPEAVQWNKFVYGALHSALAVGLIQWGGFPLFQRLMSLCVGVMFAVVVVTAVALVPPWMEVARGLFIPRIPPGGVPWTLALIGGVGGTVTVLCYGYWIREQGRTGEEEITVCRRDLAAGYIVTAIFGMSMLVIGNSLGSIGGSGALLLATIADRLQETFGPAGSLAKWAFLVGAYAAVFSSLLGVWQSVPYLFADLWTKLASDSQQTSRVDVRSRPYQYYLLAMSILPLIGLVAVNFRAIQKTYAIVGSLFVPLLAALLLYLNGRSKFVGHKHRNSLATSVVLAGTMLFFAIVAGLEVYDQLFANN